MAATVEEVKSIIQAALPDAEVHVADPMRDGEHFEAIVISAPIDGMTLVKRHQAVMKPLKEAFASNVHAMQLKTFTPAKWEEEKQNYNL